MVKDKIIGYCSISADKIRADIENKRPFENNIIRCIPLRDVNSFTMTEMPNISDLIVIYKEGFILEDIKGIIIYLFLQNILKVTEINYFIDFYKNV